MSDERGRIRRALVTQDNRATAHPIFAVQQRVREYGVDLGYTDAYLWHNVEDDWAIADEEKAAELDRLEDEGEETAPWYQIGYRDRWEFVQPFLTEEGAKTYLKVNGHNLTDPRIYVYSGWRNAEWIFLREHFQQKDTPTLTAKARCCNQAGPMGGGCKDSWHVGGNYGSHVCRNPDHHDEQEPQGDPES